MNSKTYAKVQAKLARQRAALTAHWTLTKNGKPFGDAYPSAHLANLALCALLNDYFRDYPEADSHPYNYCRVGHDGGPIKE